MSRTYDVAELAKALGIHRNTVRRWIKDGMPTLDAVRPTLIHGTDAKAFLARQRDDRRVRCAVGQLFCLKCRAPRTPWDGITDVEEVTTKVSRITAICPDCETIMHQRKRTSDVPKFLAALVHGDWERND